MELQNLKYSIEEGLLFRKETPYFIDSAWRYNADHCKVGVRKLFPHHGTSWTKHMDDFWLQLIGTHKAQRIGGMDKDKKYTTVGVRFAFRTKGGKFVFRLVEIGIRDYLTAELAKGWDDLIVEPDLFK